MQQKQVLHVRLEFSFKDVFTHLCICRQCDRETEKREIEKHIACPPHGWKQSMCVSWFLKHVSRNPSKQSQQNWNWHSGLGCWYCKRKLSRLLNEQSLFATKVVNWSYLCKKAQINVSISAQRWVGRWVTHREWIDNSKIGRWMARWLRGTGFHHLFTMGIDSKLETFRPSSLKSNTLDMLLYKNWSSDQWGGFVCPAIQMALPQNKISVTSRHFGSFLSIKR